MLHQKLRPKSPTPNEAEQKEHYDQLECIRTGQTSPPFRSCYGGDHGALAGNAMAWRADGVGHSVCIFVRHGGDRRLCLDTKHLLATMA